MTKRLVGIVTVLLSICVCIVLGIHVGNLIDDSINKKHNDNIETEENNVELITLNTTVNNVIANGQTGTYRIEQMYVERVAYEADNTVLVLLEDNYGYLWTVEDVYLNPYDDVLVLMNDNGTPDDICDDEIIYCWVGCMFLGNTPGDVEEGVAVCVQET